MTQACSNAHFHAMVCGVHRKVRPSIMPLDGAISFGNSIDLFYILYRHLIPSRQHQVYSVLVLLRHIACQRQQARRTFEIRHNEQYIAIVVDRA